MTLKLSRTTRTSLVGIIILSMILTASGCCFGETTNTSRVDEQTAEVQYILVSHGSPDETMFKTISERLRNKPEARVQFGVSLLLCYLGKPIDEEKEKLVKFLRLASEYQLPTMVQFDAIDNQDAYPELWNWWDPEKPGFNPENRKNVEWTSWSPDSAVKLGWRNWGSQHRVFPMINLASDAYRNLCFKQLGVLIPIILDWAKEPGNENLLIGIQMGNEVSLGVNNYILPGGNANKDKPAKEDPDFKLNFEIWPGFGAEPIGYAAVKTQGLAKGGVLKEEDIAKVTEKYLLDLCKFAKDLGVPRNKLFTHAGGWREGQLFFYSALNEYSCPGWSFYDHARDPRTDVTAMDALKKSDAPFWCNAETFMFEGRNKQDWIEAIENNLKIPRIRYMNIRNWYEMRERDYIFDAIKIIQGRMSHSQRCQPSRY